MVMTKSSTAGELSLFEAFRWLLRDRTGVDIAEGMVHNEEELARDIRKSLRLDVDRECTKESEAMERIGVMEPGAMEWSANSLDFVRVVAAVGSCLHPNVRAESFVLGQFFTDLSVNERVISHLDERTTKFTALKQLSLDSNCLKSIAILPPNLEILHARNNEIASLEGPELPSLRHLGLAYNDVDDLRGIASRFPNLLSLDMSYNRLCRLRDLGTEFTGFTDFRRLLLQGNPCALTPAYRLQLTGILAAAKLQTIDDVPVTEEERTVAAALPSDCADALTTKFTLEVVMEAFEGIPYSLVGEGEYVITMKDNRGNEMKSPVFLRGPPPPKEESEKPDPEDAEENHPVTEAPPIWPVVGEELPVSINVVHEAFDELAIWNWLLVNGIPFELHRVVADPPPSEEEQPATLILAGIADLSESELFIPPRVEESIPEFDEPDEHPPEADPSKEESSDIPEQEETTEQPERKNQMERHIAAGHFAVSTGKTRVPFWKESDSREASGIGLFITVKAWTPVRQAPAEDITMNT
ncbi:leucine rich repeat containing 43 [Perkinsus chesapeaki]|uniref:Leucine rich repeat containing 43 n=1 Tax=Perkinsus chesapeaki TaxID=330153 RepID=A0A7J6LHP6_PERCH|nr:leucine rich repeat containing 43 [Perkinsus chesapeaki]